MHPSERRLLALCTHISQRYALPVVLTALLLTAVALNYTIKNIGINTDTTDMLSDQLAWRQNAIQYDSDFPQYSDLIAIVIDAETPDQVQDAALALEAELSSNHQQFEWLYLGANDRFFRQQGLLYLELTELEELADQLAEMQPFMARLQQDQSLRGLFSLLSEALQQADSNPQLNLDPVFKGISSSLSQLSEPRAAPMSWQALMSGKQPDRADLRSILLAHPVMDFSQLLPGKDALFAIRDAVKKLGLEDQGVRVRLTGGIALSYEELETVSRGAQRAGLLSLVMVAIILIIGLRSVWLVLATLITLICGLILTGAFATLAIGELNMISVAFAVLYIGLGSDFAIHYCLRYREFIRHGLDQNRALDATSMDVGGALTLCAFTTAIGFFAFIPTAYSGVAELGLISGTGMFISLIFSMSMLPALLKLMPAFSLPAESEQHARALLYPQLHAALIKRLSILLGIVSLLLLPWLQFDHNPLNLQDQGAESVQTFHDLMENKDTAPWSMVTVAADRSEAQRLAVQLSELAVVEQVISLQDFVPAGQDDKARVIEDLLLTLGGDMNLSETDSAPSPTQQLSALTDFQRLLSDYAAAHAEQSSAQNLLTQLNSLLDDLNQQTEAEQASNIAQLQSRLLSSLPGRLDSLQLSLEAQAFNEDGIPAHISSRWKTADGRLRLDIKPAQDLNQNSHMEAFVDQVLRVAPAATDTPAIYVESSRAVVAAFNQAFISALLVIGILLLFLLDKKSDVLLVMYPLLLAGALTGAASVLIGMPINFANIIALPLLLGIGVDSGIHIVHRYRTAPPKDGNLLATATARAVLFSALTTTCSFGNLATSPHTGTASMGLLLTIGLLFTLICTLLVLPALLTLSDKSHAA